MSLRLFRRVWVTSCNAMMLAIVASNLLDDPESRSIFNGGVLLMLISVLLLGTLLEWFDRNWPAAMVNSGFWAIFGFGTLGKYLWMVMTEAPRQRDPEGPLAVEIVGIPCSVVAIAVFLLYWLTWREADKVRQGAAEE